MTAHREAAACGFRGFRLIAYGGILRLPRAYAPIKEDNQSRNPAA